MTMSPNLLRTGLRLGACGVLFALTLEAAARLDDYVRDGAPLLKPYTINTVFRASPFGREGIPGARFAKWSINSLGYRGPEPVAGRINVLTFGASETFGIYESPDMEYPRQLEAQLNQASPGRFDVINIGLPGLRIGRTGYLVHAIKATGAKIVVIYPSPANYIGTTEPFCASADAPAAVRLTLGDQVRLSGKFDQLVKKTLPASVMTPLREFSIWRETRNTEVISRVPQASLDAFRADLECAVDAAEREGARVVLATHGTYFGDSVRPEDQAMLVAWRRFYPELAESGFLDLEQRANAAIASVAAERQLALADAANVIPRGPEFFADFVHFTDAGAQRMAKLLGVTIVSAP